MATAMDRCEKHDVMNCADCTGVTAAHNESLKDLTSWQQHQVRRDLPSLPYIPGGPTMYAKFPGNCVGCGRRYQRDEGIHYDRELDGWIGVDCCAEVVGRG